MHLREAEVIAEWYPSLGESVKLTDDGQKDCAKAGLYAKVLTHNTRDEDGEYCYRIVNNIVLLRRPDGSDLPLPLAFFTQIPYAVENSGAIRSGLAKAAKNKSDAPVR